MRRTRKNGSQAISIRLRKHQRGIHKKMQARTNDQKDEAFVDIYINGDKTTVTAGSRL